MEDTVEILIAEDSLTQSLKLRRILEAEHYAVRVAPTGREALDAVREKRPTMVITDVMMPEMNGFELCAEIKADPALKDMPVMILTSLSNTQDVVKGLPCGANNFLTKPYEASCLLQRVRYILANLELRRHNGSEMALKVFFAGEKHVLTAERIQIIDLLFSTFESAVFQNGELQRAKQQLREALEQIKELEAGYRTMLESNADGLVVVDEDGVVRYANPKALSILACDEAEFIDRPFPYASALAAESVLEIGETGVFLESRPAPTRWDGGPAHVVSIRDTTKTVRLGERLSRRGSEP